ncbi:unnamed protein product [Prorocentrum cordatum]|uniref:Uncharacterized protein n=1 Tax=Prorocentrum cordatum TaxID=2364126 RepID=A0ABN9T640_9DINO|nr:unnamed protein product [Polarella glacialis]
MAAAAVRRGPAPGAPPAGAEGGRRSLARWGCAAAAGLALVHFGPELAALAAHGSARHVPGPVGLRRLWEAGLRDRPRQLGGTRFARAEAYLHGPSGRSGPVLPEVGIG